MDVETISMHVNCGAVIAKAEGSGAETFSLGD
jgi:hypothetical protein